MSSMYMEWNIYAHCNLALIINSYWSIPVLCTECLKTNMWYHKKYNTNALMNKNVVLTEWPGSCVSLKYIPYMSSNISGQCSVSHASLTV